jgi:hypothetical protein
VAFPRPGAFPHPATAPRGHSTTVAPDRPRSPGALLRPAARQPLATAQIRPLPLPAAHPGRPPGGRLLHPGAHRRPGRRPRTRRIPSPPLAIPRRRTRGPDAERGLFRFRVAVLSSASYQLSIINYQLLSILLVVCRVCGRGCGGACRGGGRFRRC